MLWCQAIAAKQQRATAAAKISGENGNRSVGLPTGNTAAVGLSAKHLQDAFSQTSDLQTTVLTDVSPGVYFPAETVALPVQEREAATVNALTALSAALAAMPQEPSVLRPATSGFGCKSKHVVARPFTASGRLDPHPRLLCVNGIHRLPVSEHHAMQEQLRQRAEVNPQLATASADGIGICSGSPRNQANQFD